MAAAVAVVVADLVEVEVEVEGAVALAAVVAESRGPRAAVACRGHLAVAVFHGLLAVLCLDRPPQQGHQSAVPPHLTVPAAELRARQVRQRDQVLVPEAEHDLQFSPELDPALVPDQDWQVVQESDPDHPHCPLPVRELALVPGLAWDLDHRLCHPLVLALDWQLELESARE